MGGRRCAHGIRVSTHETEITAPLSIEYRGYRINQTNFRAGLIHLEAHTIADEAARPG